MPTYICTSKEGRLSAPQRTLIASEITRIHCEVTGAPGFFAQVIFETVKPGNHFLGGALLQDDLIFVYGRIRSGRATQDKTRMIVQMAKAVGDAAAVSSLKSVWVYVADLPARHMVEFGHVLPEAGDEAAWTAALPPADREFMQLIGK